MSVYNLSLSSQWLLPLCILFLILLCFRFSSPKLVFALLILLLIIIAVQIVLSTYAHKEFDSKSFIPETPAPNDDTKLSATINAGQTIKEPKVSTRSTISSASNLIPALSPENFPVMNHQIDVRIKGIEEEVFLSELEKHMGFRVSRNGQLLVDITFDGPQYSSIVPKSGNKEYNHHQGSLIIRVDGQDCISAGELILEASDYRGLNAQELHQKIEDKKLVILRQEMVVIAQSIRNCILQ